MQNENTQQLDDKDSVVKANPELSEENAKLGEVEVETYEAITDNGTPQEDLSEIASADDV